MLANKMSKTIVKNFETPNPKNNYNSGVLE